MQNVEERNTIMETIGTRNEQDMLTVIHDRSHGCWHKSNSSDIKLVALGSFHLVSLLVLSETFLSHF